MVLKSCFDECMHTELYYNLFYYPILQGVIPHLLLKKILELTPYLDLHFRLQYLIVLCKILRKPIQALG